MNRTSDIANRRVPGLALVALDRHVVPRAPAVACCESQSRAFLHFAKKLIPARLREKPEESTQGVGDRLGISIL